MNRHPLAVFSSGLGLPSETFIRRHMVDLLPGASVAVVHRRAPGDARPDASFPCLVLEESRKEWRWLYRRGLHFLGLTGGSPTQMMVEEFLLRHGVQVILSEYLNLSLNWLELARRLGIRFYAHAHGYDVSKSLRDPRMRERYLKLETAAGIITVSESSRARLIDLGLDGSRIHVIPCGVRVPEVRVQRVNGETVRCLGVGRMVAKKAPLLTLQAFRQAFAVHGRMHLDLVGDGELLEEAAGFVREHGLADQVTLHGSRPNAEVLALMQAADIFVQHSRTDPETGDEEGLPVGILEAMAAGLPVISTRHAGIPEAVIEGETGILVDEGGVNAMAEGIILLARDAGLRERFGDAAWRRAKARYSWEGERRELIRLLGLNDSTMQLRQKIDQ